MEVFRPRECLADERRADDGAAASHQTAACLPRKERPADREQYQRKDDSRQQGQRQHTEDGGPKLIDQLRGLPALRFARFQ